jgi:hypothetical protein
VGKFVPNCHKNIPNGGKIHLIDLKRPKMFIKYTHIFHSKAYKIKQNWDFWSENNSSGSPGFDGHPMVACGPNIFSPKKFLLSK